MNTEYNPYIQELNNLLDVTATLFLKYISNVNIANYLNYKLKDGDTQAVENILPDNINLKSIIDFINFNSQQCICVNYAYTNETYVYLHLTLKALKKLLDNEATQKIDIMLAHLQSLFSTYLQFTPANAEQEYVNMDCDDIIF